MVNLKCFCIHLKLFHCCNCCGSLNTACCNRLNHCEKTCIDSLPSSIPCTISYRAVEKATDRRLSQDGKVNVWKPVTKHRIIFNFFFTFILFTPKQNSTEWGLMKRFCDWINISGAAMNMSWHVASCLGVFTANSIACHSWSVLKFRVFCHKVREYRKTCLN